MKEKNTTGKHPEPPSLFRPVTEDPHRRSFMMME
jgi:hypothetical protein